MPSKSALRVLATACLLFTAACATRTAPAIVPVGTPKHPEFLFPVVPSELQRSGVADRLERGWQFLQNNSFREAEREFAAALQRSPEFYPAQAGNGYLALARADNAKALIAFDAVLGRAPQYVPALVGRGQALLALTRDPEALAAFEAAVALDASLVDLRSRIDVLRFRNVQAIVDKARSEAAAGRLDAARAAYVRALEISPDSAFLNRELGIVDRRAGNATAALEQFRRAAELDPLDAVSLTQIGELLEQQGDFAGAEAAYRKAADVEPTSELSRRIAAVAANASDARLPAEFRAIADAPQISRGDLAALVGIRLEPVLRDAPNRQVVMTDIRGHWAAAWIARVAAAGVIEPFENHTFQARNTVRRVDLARAVNQLVRLIAAKQPDLRNRLSERPKIADIPPGHLDYPAVSVAVATGIMALADGQGFGMSNVVSGGEALTVIGRLRALAGLER